MKVKQFFTAVVLTFGMVCSALASTNHVNGGLPMVPNDVGYSWNSTSVFANAGTFSEMFDFTLSGPDDWNVSLSEPSLLGNFGPFTASLDGGPALSWTASGMNMAAGFHTFEVFGSANGATSDWANYSLKFAVAVPVPEPESYALLLAGLGVVVVARRRWSKSLPAV